MASIQISGKLVIAASVAVGVLGLLWLVDGLRDESFLAITTGGYLLLAGLGGILVSVRAISRQTEAATVRPVGELADVLQAVGNELRAAQTRVRSTDTIRWGSAELELSIAMEEAAKGGIAFKVMNGEVTQGSTRTSRVKINLWPADDDLPEVGGCRASGVVYPACPREG